MSIFGDRVEAPADAGAAEWIAERIGSFGSVGGLIPNVYERYVRVAPASPGLRDWWEHQRLVVEAMARTAANYTTTPERAWFAIWEGHGFDSTKVIRAALSELPKLHLPHRTYYLLTGDVLAAAALIEPGGRGVDSSFRPPDLWWPDDKAWFVGTDVDFWSNFVGGPIALGAAIAAAVPTGTEEVTLTDRLPIED